jgi:hypothetical protein
MVDIEVVDVLELFDSPMRRVLLDAEAESFTFVPTSSRPLHASPVVHIATQSKLLFLMILLRDRIHSTGKTCQPKARGPSPGPRRRTSFRD